MSWGIQKAGVGGDLSLRVQENLTTLAGYGQDELTKKILAKAQELQVLFTEAYPTAVVAFETNGHVDSTAGAMTLSLKAYRP